MRTAKELSIISVFVALLIGGQFALSFVSGVEIVTVLMVTFCYRFGVWRGCVVGVAFSLLRCFIFGFMPNVIILYLVFYSLLAIAFGLLGIALKKSLSVKALLIIVITAIFFTVLFTALDNLITPLFYSFSKVVWKIYFSASLITMIPQIICTAVTVSVLSFPLIKIYKTIKI